MKTNAGGRATPRGLGAMARAPTEAYRRMWRESRLIWRSWPDSQITEACLRRIESRKRDAEEWTMIRAMDDAAFESWLESWLVSHGVPGRALHAPAFF